MKRGRWLVALFCALVLLVCGSAISVSSANAQTEGKSFTALDLYRTQKITAQTPKTFETTIQLSKSVTERGGIIIGNYAGTPNAFSMEIFSNGNPRLYHRVDNTEYNCVFTGVDIRGDSYVHLAITLDPSDYKARCYVDGVLKETKPLIVPSYTYTNTPVVGGDLRSGNGVYFKGKMKSVALYSDVRTLAEVKADKTAVDVNDDNLLLAYDLDNSGAATFEDKSKNGNDLKANVTWVDDVAPPENYAYSFMVIGDTQILADNYRVNSADKGFEKVYDYVVDNLDEKNVECVIGLGDITDKNNAVEWSLATSNFIRLDGEVNYTLVRGNHDGAGEFNSHLSTNTRYDEQIIEYYQEGSLLNVAHAFTAGQLDYLVLCLDYGPSDEVLEWAGRICEKYSKHNVIVTTHAYMFRDGTTLDDGDVYPPSKYGGVNDGDDIWEKFVKKHGNIVMVLSGHDPCDDIVLRQEEGEKGNVISQMLIDPQGVDAATEGGLGLVSTFYFSEDGKTVTVDWYSVIKNKYFKSTNQFSFEVHTVEPAPKTQIEVEGNGKVTPSALTIGMENVSVKCSPASYHYVSKVELDGMDVTESLINGTLVIPAITENTSVKVTFSEKQKYTLSLLYDQSKGTVTPVSGVGLVNYAGKTLSFMVKAKSGYEIDSVTYDDKKVSVSSVGRVTVVSKEQDSVLLITFKSKGGEGEGTPPPPVNDNDGGSGCATVTPTGGDGTTGGGGLMIIGLLIVVSALLLTKKRIRQ